MQSSRETMIGPRPRLEPDSLVIVLIGASAVGKSTLAEHLCDAGIVDATPTWTTRPPRPGELSTAYDHHFVSDEAFDRQSRMGSFLDERSLYGFRYGMPHPSRPAKGREALMVLKPVFMPRFLERFPAARVYQIDASAEVLPGRMGDRGQSPEDIAQRMSLHQAEAAEAREFAHVIFNNDGPLELTLTLVEEQIAADRDRHAGSQNLVGA